MGFVERAESGNTISGLFSILNTLLFLEVNFTVTIFASCVYITISKKSMFSIVMDQCM